MSIGYWLAIVAVASIVILLLVRGIFLGRKGRVGTVRNVHRESVGFGTPVTAFEIHQADGTIFYVGFEGHEYVNGLFEGAPVRFWPTNDSVMNELIPYRTEHRDGSISVGGYRRRYYKLSKILFLPTDVPLDVVGDSDEQRLDIEKDFPYSATE